MTTERMGVIVFADIVGFTELTELYGDDLALALVDLQARTVRESLPASGRIVKELGDGLLLWFDDLCEGVLTSIVLQHRFDGPTVAVGGGADGDEVGDEVEMWVRIGVHRGAPRWRGDDIIGRDVNLTSRLTALAGAGEVVCSGDLVDAWTAGDLPEVEFVPLGPTFVKGIAEPVRTYRIETDTPVVADRLRDIGAVETAD